MRFVKRNKKKKSSLFLELHYDNPELLPLVDPGCGMRVWYTEMLREHDTGKEICVYYILLHINFYLPDGGDCKFALRNKKKNIQFFYLMDEKSSRWKNVFVSCKTLY